MANNFDLSNEEKLFVSSPASLYQFEVEKDVLEKTGEVRYIIWQGDVLDSIIVSESDMLALAQVILEDAGWSFQREVGPKN